MATRLSAWRRCGARAGRTAQAERAYNRALEIDPNDGSARCAGLVALRGGGDLAAQESQFRHMLAQDDSQPAVHHALGNVLASQGRWAEAQQAYFNASAGDPDQPDYAYNLAISLERLKQPPPVTTAVRSSWRQGGPPVSRWTPRGHVWRRSTPDPAAGRQGRLTCRT